MGTHLDGLDISLHFIKSTSIETGVTQIAQQDWQSANGSFVLLSRHGPSINQDGVFSVPSAHCRGCAGLHRGPASGARPFSRFVVLGRWSSCSLCYPQLLTLPSAAVHLVQGPMSGFKVSSSPIPFAAASNYDAALFDGGGPAAGAQQQAQELFSMAADRPFSESSEGQPEGAAAPAAVGGSPQHGAAVGPTQPNNGLTSEASNVSSTFPSPVRPQRSSGNLAAPASGASNSLEAGRRKVRGTVYGGMHPQYFVHLLYLLQQATWRASQRVPMRRTALQSCPACWVPPCITG